MLNNSSTKMTSFGNIPDTKYSDNISYNKSCSFVESTPKKNVGKYLAKTPEKKLTDFK